jgi:hypothetical protein
VRERPIQVTAIADAHSSGTATTMSWFRCRLRGIAAAPRRIAADRLGIRLAVRVGMRTSLVLMLAAAAACSSGNGSVWSPSVSKLVLRSSGGFLPPSQPTSDCPTQGVEYTLVVADSSLSARRCTPGPNPPYPLMLATASRVLTTAEVDALVPKLEALRVVSVDTCGADKSAVLVTVTTPSGTTEYGDSFYSCPNDNDTRPTIDTNALDAALQAFGQLAFPDP